MAGIFIINGSPRKNQNTAKMCESFARGAKSKGIEAEIIHLYDYKFSGCRSCFACKLKGGKSFGKCGFPDDITPVLEKVSHGDGLVLASPVYFGNITGEMRCFMERLIFPFFEYKEGYPSLAPKKFPTAVIYTMNVTEEISNQMYPQMMKSVEWALGAAFTRPVRICAYDTYQFSDYSKYVAECFDPAHKKRQLEEQLPKDLQKAYDEGEKMAERILLCSQ